MSSLISDSDSDDCFDDAQENFQPSLTTATATDDESDDSYVSMDSFKTTTANPNNTKQHVKPSGHNPVHNNRENLDPALRTSQINTVPKVSSNIRKASQQPAHVKKILTPSVSNALQTDTSHVKSNVGTRNIPPKANQGKLANTKPAIRPPRSASTASTAEALVSKKVARIPKSAIAPKASGTKSVASAATSIFSAMRAGTQYNTWLDTQQRAFTAWLNHELAPHVYQDDLREQEQEQGSIFDHPTTRPQQQMPSPLREFAQKMDYERNIRIARALYETEDISSTMRKLTEAILANKFTVRPTVVFHAEVGIRQDITQMLLSYSLPWLRIGLETVVREPVSLSAGGEREEIAEYIHKNILAYADMSKIESIMGSGKLTNVKEAQQKYVLRTLLVLVGFLDKAKSNRILPKDPCLFEKSAPYKSSRSLLEKMSNSFLCGEGDITRHLGLLNVKTAYVQTPFDEFDYAVNNLACDLRDGVRLCRLVELHTKKWDLTTQLRFPATSRAHSTHNAGILFRALQSEGVVLGGINNGFITPSDLIDGHRERTLALLWQLMIHWKLPSLIDVALLENEIDMLMLEFQKTKKMTFENPVLEDVYFASDRLSLLLRWCQTVCSFYDVPIVNFTKSFADGRAFCYLISHYHPALLDARKVRDAVGEAKQQEAKEDDQKLSSPSMIRSWIGYFSPVRKPTKSSSITDAQRSNFKLLKSCVQKLGGIPLILKVNDMVVPDEKAVITYVAFLSSRLLHLSQEIRAAKVIQFHWRRRHYAAGLKSQDQAATLIQRTWRRRQMNKQVALQRLNRIREKEKSAATKIQAFWIGYRQRRSFLNLKLAAITVQRISRGYLARQHLRLLRAVVLVQAHIRRKIVSNRLARMQRAATCIQKAYRAHVSRRKLLWQKHQAAVTIQAFARRNIIRARYLQTKDACLLIQSQYRAYRRERSRREAQAATILQAAWRQHKHQKEYVRLRTATIKLQLYWRLRQRRQTIAEVSSAIRIQSWMRCVFAKREFHRKREAICRIQRTVRAYQDRTRVRHHNAAVRIQSCFRMYVARQRHVAMKWAARVVHVRRSATLKCRFERNQYIALCKAAVVLQQRRRATIWMRKVKGDFLVQHKAVVRIQAIWRGRMCRQNYVNTRSLLIKLQQRRRSNMQSRAFRISYENLRAAILLVQSRRRALLSGRLQRNAYLEQRRAAVILQSAWRGKCAREKFAASYQAIVKIQTRRRATLLTRELHGEFKTLRNTVVFLQSRRRALLAMRMAVLEFETLRKRVISMQAIVRGNSARKSTARLLQRTQSAVRIQAWWQMKCTEQRYLYLRKAVLWCQEKRKALVAGRTARTAYLEIQEATVCIQRGIRNCRLARQQRAEYIELRTATISIQRLWKTKTTRVEYLTMRRSAICIQNFVRSWSCRTLYERQKCAAVVLQSALRAYLARRYVAMLRQQRKAHLAELRERRTRYLENWGRAATISLSALRIQRAYRRYRTMQLAKTRIDAILTLQRWFRSVLQRMQFLHTRRQICRLQLAYRRHLQTRHAAANVIQTNWRKAIGRVRERRRLHSVLIIQSYWRGHCVRRRSSVQVRKARARVRKANDAAEDHMKLSNRTSMALEILKTSKQLTPLRQACYHLDVVTSLSSVCCQRLVEHDVIGIIFTIIKDCNRSKPYMQVITNAVHILNHLALHPSTRSAILAPPEASERIVELIQHYRENEAIMVPILKTVLYLFQDPDSLQAIRSTPNGPKRIKSVQELVSRKLGTDRKTIRPGDKLSGMVEIDHLLGKVVRRLFA